MPVRCISYTLGASFPPLIPKTHDLVSRIDTAMVRRLQLLPALSSLLLSTSSYASPIANATTINYQHEPKTRGTVSLLLSCTVTLVLCVWTALHPNIEPLEFSRSKLAGASQLVGKVILGLTALVAPELVLSIALHQFLIAWQYRRVLNAGLVPGAKTNGRGGGGDVGDASGAEAVGGKAEIGLKKAFYAIMGGFAVEGSRSFAVTLDMDMLENDAAVEKIRNFPIEKIDDKSKADYLAKVLACAQACWIVLQTLGRKLNDLPITLLELNTVLHVINAVVMYGLWLEKPVDVSRPSIIGQSEEPWKNEIVETTTFLPASILLSSQRRVKERIVPLLRSADEHSRLLAAQIDGCDVSLLSDDILGRLERLSTPLKLFKVVASVVGVTANLLVDRIRWFFDDWRSPEILGEDFGEMFADALGGEIADALGARSGAAARQAFRVLSFPTTFRAGISGSRMLPGDYPNSPRNGLRGGASGGIRDARALHEAIREAVRAASCAALGAANSGAGSGVSLDSREAACGREILNAILPASPGGAITSQGGAIKYLEHAASNAITLPIAYETIKRENAARTTKDEESSRPEPRQRIHGEVFLHVRQRALDFANDVSKGDEVRAAAFKAAFHLDPRVAKRPAGVEGGGSLGILEQLLSTLSEGGRHIWNQFVWVPGIFGEGEELKWFDRRWCNTHKAVLLVFATCSGAFYGGMHAFKWNDQFSSETKKILWEVSTCIGAAGVVPLSALAVIVWTRPPLLVSGLCWIVLIVSGPVFLAARTFLIVESFLSLRDLPVGAYETVQWAESIPHI